VRNVSAARLGPLLSDPLDLFDAEISARCLSLHSGSTFANLLGEGPLQYNRLPGNRKGLTLTKGYLLVAIASNLAITGKGDTRILLCLKQRLLQSVWVDIQHGKGVISLQGLCLMLLLGSPIVCLVSGRMPGGSSVREYLAETKASASMCCAESAALATESFLESHVHWQYLTAAINQQHCKQTEPACDGWLEYIARYLEM
jgi:hypothetical protein